MWNAKQRLLVMGDDSTLCAMLSKRLRESGFIVEVGPHLESVLNLELPTDPDIIIVDVIAPQKMGIDVCRHLRSHGVAAPILMLSASHQPTDRVQALRSGVDLYLKKPFETVELLTCLEALLRRETATAGCLRVNLRSREVFKDSQSLSLSSKELDLLLCFMKNRGHILSRPELLREVWGFDCPWETRTVDMHVSFLRHKLESNPRKPELIRTVKGKGYKFIG